jgi:hypothetical protein
MWILFSIFLSLPIFALESFDTLTDVRILRSLPGNVIQVNRGLEDGITKDDHGKFLGADGNYGARGLCLKSNFESSYWKLYRVPYSEVFSKDNAYTLVGIDRHEMPERVTRLRDETYNFDEVKRDPGPNPFNVKRDLPERLTQRDLIETVTPEKRKLFIEEAINRGQLERDLRDYHLSFYASPFMRQSINEGESLRFGVRGENVASRYRLITQFEQQQSKLRDPLTKATVSTRSTTGQAQFIIHRLSDSLSSLTLLNYNSARFSRLATPKFHWQFGLIGATWHLFESKTWEYFDLSYIPLYDLRETETLNPSGEVKLVKKSGVKINERVSLENVLWVKPFQDLTNWSLHSDDLNLSNDLKLIMSLTDKLFMDYNLVYQRDKIWATLSNLPESNTINSVNLRYDVDL